MLKNFLIATTFLLVSNINAQDILTANGDKIASISTAGIVTDGNDQQIGEITSTGEVKNYKGTVIGIINGDNFSYADGSVAGNRNVTDSETQVLLMNNILFGTVQNGNTLLSSNGVISYRSTGTVSETQLLAFFFFF